MHFDPVGLCLAFIALLVSVFAPQISTLAAFGCLAFTSTAIGSLTALGNASVTVPQFGLVLFLWSALSRRGAVARMKRAIVEDSVPQTLLIFTFVAVLGALCLPRLMNWGVDVFSLTRFNPDLDRTLPLQPTTGNITQSIYLLASVIAFFVPIMAIRSDRDVWSFVAGLKMLIVMQAGLAAVDIVGKYGFGADALEFLRTANYTILAADAVNGVWRISGIYVEASYFAAAVAAQLAFCFVLWRSGADHRFAPAMSLVLIALLLLSTSSTGYVFLALAIAWCLWLFGYQCAGRGFERGAVVLLLLLICGIAAVALAALIGQADGIISAVSNFLQESLLRKLDLDSGFERSEWNQMAVRNFFETAGLGTGLGSSRSSSWVLALVSQTGVIGTAIFGAFLMLLIVPPAWRGRRLPARTAALNGACQAYIVAAVVVASIAWSLVDLGILFYLLAGLSVRFALGQRAPRFASEPPGEQGGMLEPAKVKARSITSGTASRQREIDIVTGQQWTAR